MSKKVLLDHNRNHTQIAQEEDGKMYVETTFHDQEGLDNNARLRNAELFKNAKLSLHKGEDIRAVISCPSQLEWQLFEEDNPETAQKLVSRHEVERLQAVKTISILHPEWVIYTRM